MQIWSSWRPEMNRSEKDVFHFNLKGMDLNFEFELNGIWMDWIEIDTVLFICWHLWGSLLLCLIGTTVWLKEPFVSPLCASGICQWPVEIRSKCVDWSYWQSGWRDLDMGGWDPCYHHVRVLWQRPSLCCFDPLLRDSEREGHNVTESVVKNNMSSKGASHQTDWSLSSEQTAVSRTEFWFPPFLNRPSRACRVLNHFHLKVQHVQTSTCTWIVCCVVFWETTTGR